MKKIVTLANENICKNALMETAFEISKYHRIQSSPGFRAAANYCVSRLKEGGVDAELISYPANGVSSTGTNRPLREWDIKSAQCSIDGFGKIADYEEEALSIIVRSIPCDFREHGLEVCYLDKSSDKNDYTDEDFSGKLCFVRGNINDYAWCVTEKGALGLITDFVLNIETQQDVHRYTSFWWAEEQGEKKYFGFVLTPTQGKALAEFCIRKKAENQKVLAKGYIDSSIYDGTLDVVSAFIPGKSGKEIWITAHLCHPKTSSNDNASGVSAGIGAMWAIVKLLNNKTIDHLNHGIRLLLIPEMSGTVEYLHALGEGKKNVLAGINLDMVGGRQDPGYGPLTLTALPRSTPSFTEHVAAMALEEAAIGYQGFSPDARMPAVNYAFESFSTGSDHYILSDPTIGIPTTMLGQWPDKFYHTSGDTMDKLSPDVLKTSAKTAMAFALFTANMTREDIPQVLVKTKVRLAAELEKTLKNGIKNREAYYHILETYIASLNDFWRFFPGKSDIISMVENQTEALSAVASAFILDFSDETPMPQKGDKRIPKRNYSMPLAAPALAAKLAGKSDIYDKYAQNAGKLVVGFMPSLTEYYIDGNRTIDEIVRLVSIDYNADASVIIPLIEFLYEIRLVSF